MDLEGFIHVEPEALLEELRFAMAHAKDIEKMAVMGDRTWIKAWIEIGGPFTHSEGKHFNRPEVQAAWEWVKP